MHEPITLDIDGRQVSVEEGCTVAAAIAIAHRDAMAVMRRSVSGELRGAFCAMGMCQECRVTIDGVRHRLACQTICAAGMLVVTAGAAP
jgi:predicted molibdopterin-dependent oxidoreductase YjgC